MKYNYLDYLYALRLYDDFISFDRLLYHLGSASDEETKKQAAGQLLLLERVGIVTAQNQDDESLIKLTKFGISITDIIADVAVDTMLLESAAVV